MTENELQQIQKIGESYCTKLGGLVDSMDSPEAQIHAVRIVFDAALVQMLNRRGPVETCSFLRRMAQRIENDAQRVLQ